MRNSIWLAGLAAVSLGGVAAAEESQCRVAEFSFTPSDNLQIVVWIEDKAGNYVDTAFITKTTGSYGLGNRPGIMEFNSGPWWPYGRRTTTFPVWAERHGLEFPMVIFQDDDDRDLSHPLDHSSREMTYCRPIQADEPLWDAQSCASTVWTDKGKLSGDKKSPYPPRTDISMDPEKDDASVAEMVTMNPFDAVSRATPLGGALFSTQWTIPKNLPDGDYVAWFEVSKEFDQNQDYDYPSPTVSWSEYGLPYRGQPSVVYKSSFRIGQDAPAAMALDYVGYGDPEGMSGQLFSPDGTISSSPGSGAGRLLVTSEGGDMYRVKVAARGDSDSAPPGDIGEIRATKTASNSADFTFVAPGDDGAIGTVAGYDVRYLVGSSMSEEEFETATTASVSLTPLAPGADQTFTVNGLLPETDYVIGVRAVDKCGNVSKLSTVLILTPKPKSGEVDACFIATAAYGSFFAQEVGVLRLFRDLVLRKSVGGELLVEAYYTFSPMVAQTLAPSPQLRSAARTALAGGIGWLKQWVGFPLANSRR